MIPRYTRPEIGAVWTPRRKMEGWLEVELAVTEALAEAGVVPEADAAACRERASFAVEAVEERERTTNHDVAAFVKEHTGYSIGGVCPIGHCKDTIVLVDRDLLRFDSIWAAAGHPHAVFNLSPSELLAMTGAPVVDVAAPAA